MLKNQDIICIANTTWYGEYMKSTVHIMSRLAQKNRVLFVEYPFTWKDILTTIAGLQKAPVKKMLGWTKRLTLIKTDNASLIYHLVAPPVLPVDFIKNDKIFQFFFKLNALLYKRQILHSLKKIGIKNPLVITAFNPFYGLSLIGKLNEALNVYYCYDGIGTRRHGKRIFKTDEIFSRGVDAIITTSEYINKNKKKFNPHSYIVKNGVDYETFRAFAKKDLTGNERNTVGYIGSLDHRFDIETVEYAVNQLKDYNFHFTGNLRNQAIRQRLDKYSNVSFFNPVQPKEVPALLATYDAGIIPYIANEINKNIYPLKINEYMAVGVPVVMTAFADLPEFERVVSTAKKKEEFVQLLKKETANDNTDSIRKRILFARSNSWDSKTEEFGAILNKFLKNGHSSEN